MEVRFKLLSDDDILVLPDSSSILNIKNGCNGVKPQRFRSLVLCQFCVSFQKKNGQQDEIGSVRLIPASLNRYLVEKNFVNSTICYVNLKHRITVREVKPQFLRQAGMGKNDMI